LASLRSVIDFCIAIARFTVSTALRTPEARRPRVVFACGAQQYECHPLMWALPMPLLNCDVAYWYLGLADRL
jgi:hypothetical protein